jgi:hypothetical protein
VDAGAGHRHAVHMTISGRAALAPAPAAAAPVQVSEGPGREEMTRFPWPRLLIGLLVIAAASVLFLFVSYRRRTSRHGAVP